MTKLSTGLPISQWNKALAHSRYLCQLLGAHPEAIHWLTEHVNDPLQEEDLVRFLENQPDQSAPSLKLSLRKLRQHVMAHLIIRDLCHDAPLSEIMASMSLLADFVVNHALGALYAQLVEEFGAPLDERGSPQRLMVIGMGKLGGRELNVSSDVDYIFEKHLIRSWRKTAWYCSRRSKHGRDHRGNFHSGDLDCRHNRGDEHRCHH